MCYVVVIIYPNVFVSLGSRLDRHTRVVRAEEYCEGWITNRVHGAAMCVCKIPMAVPYSVFSVGGCLHFVVCSD